jgi:hypothetical protein
MATPPLQSQPVPVSGQVQMTYVDRPEISETFADSLGRMMWDGIHLRMEFVVNRLDDAQQGKPPSGRALTACRVIIPVQGVIEMAAKLQNLMAQLQASGVLRQVHMPSPQGPQRPN